MAWRQTLSRWIAGAAPEGQQRSAPYYLPISGGLLGGEGESWNWWQQGFDVRQPGRGVMVEACVAAYAQTVSMCPGGHWRLGANGGRERIETSALARIIRQPNPYQTISDLLLQQVSHLFYEGNSYGLGIRNDRNEVAELHLFDPRQSHPMVAEDGSVFYSLSGNPLVERRWGGGRIMAPARDVLHIRTYTPEHPLIGVTPILATALQAAAANAALAQQINFLRNQSRPSFVLGTDQILTKDQTIELRERWEAQAKGLGQGGTPILTAGLKPHALGVSSVDAQVIETLKLSDKGIATALRVPHALVGLDGGGAAPMASTETLMSFWLASGLGFVLNHIEEAWGLLFNLAGQPREYVEFDVGALLRPAFKDRVEGLTRAVQGGVYSPNEARAEMELPRASHGDEPRVQQQVVPLSAWGQQLQQPKAPAGPKPAPPAPDTPSADPPEASTP